MSSSQIKIETNYEILKRVSYGSSGELEKIKIHEDQKIYGLKSVPLNYPDDLEEAKMEYNLYQKNIPNILRSFGSYHDEKNKKFLYTVELMEMDLETYITQNGSLSFSQFIPIFKDILTGKKFSINIPERVNL